MRTWHKQDITRLLAVCFSGRKISKGPRTIMLQIYVGSARDLSAKNNQNTKTANCFSGPLGLQEIDTRHDVARTRKINTKRKNLGPVQTGNVW